MLNIVLWAPYFTTLTNVVEIAHEHDFEGMTLMD